MSAGIFQGHMMHRALDQHWRFSLSTASTVPTICTFSSTTPAGSPPFGARPTLTVTTLSIDARALDDFERHRQRLAIGGHHCVASLHLRQITHFVADLDGERLAVLTLQGERPVL
ncbi:MAG: hypothetical protein R3F36_07490 [Candidatus Competibacteraceae bacterium]